VARTDAKTWVLRFLKASIAIIGISYVLWNLNLHDHVLLLDPEASRPVVATVVGTPPEETWPLPVILPDGTERSVDRDEVLTRPDRTKVIRASDGASLYVLALESAPNADEPIRVLAAESKSGPGVWLTPSELQGGYRDFVPFPVREIGLNRMFAEADTTFLLLAVGVIPLIYLLTSYRWWLLLRGLEVPIPLSRALQINLVGAFYNTFMPGQTGGDVLKAYYAAKNAREQRTRAVLSVVVDRAIGLVALIIMGGICAALQWHVPQCRQVAIAAGVILLMLAGGLLVFGLRPLRVALGVEWALGKLPMQERVNKAWDGMSLYKRRPLLVLGTLLMSFPVHATIVVSAMFAGWAFSLPLNWTYYWVVVPTVVLAGAMPISPQGAGVMEFFAILLTRPQGATVGQAFALTMSIRLVQIIWNTAAGVLVLTGRYHAPTEKEQAELESEPAAERSP
jgi:uncharacterized protein (TIRG00374 family)